MTAANNYWLFGGDQQPDGQAEHQLLGQFRTIVNAKAAGRVWRSQWKNPAGKWWHVFDIQERRVVAQSRYQGYGAPESFPDVQR